MTTTLFSHSQVSCFLSCLAGIRRSRLPPAPPPVPPPLPLLSHQRPPPSQLFGKMKNPIHARMLWKQPGPWLSQGHLRSEQLWLHLGYHQRSFRPPGISSKLDFCEILCLILHKTRRLLRSFSIWISYMVPLVVLLVPLLVFYLVLLLILHLVLHLFILSAYSDRTFPVLLENNVLPRQQWRKVFIGCNNL